MRSLGRVGVTPLGRPRGDGMRIRIRIVARLGSAFGDWLAARWDSRKIGEGDARREVRSIGRSLEIAGDGFERSYSGDETRNNNK
jgi:hypothetical protein